MHILLHDIQPDCVLITETWLSNCHDSSILSLNNYNVFRKDRNNGEDSHGGVLIAIKSLYNPILVECNTDFEVIFIDLMHQNTRTRLCNVYRPPSMNLSNTRELFELLRQYGDVSCNTCIVGDFNMPHIDWPNFTSLDNISSFLLNFVHEIGLQQFVDEPTRGNNILDLVLGTRCESAVSLISNVCVNETFSHSDHSFITFDMHCERPPTSEVVFKNFRAADWDLIRAHLAMLDWENVFSDCANDCEAAWLKFKMIINNIVELYVPQCSFSNKLKAPWFNNRLKRMTRAKQRKWKKYKRSHLDQDLRNYRLYCRDVHAAVNIARGQYERNKFSNKSCRPKDFFNYIDKRTNSTSAIPSLQIGPAVVVTDSQKAEELSRHYSKVFTNDNGTTPPFPMKMPPNSCLV